MSIPQCLCKWTFPVRTLSYDGRWDTGLATSIHDDIARGSNLGHKSYHTELATCVCPQASLFQDLPGTRAASPSTHLFWAASSCPFFPAHWPSFLHDPLRCPSCCIDFAFLRSFRDAKWRRPTIPTSDGKVQRCQPFPLPPMPYWVQLPTILYLL